MAGRLLRCGRSLVLHQRIDITPPSLPSLRNFSATPKRWATYRKFGESGPSRPNIPSNTANASPIPIQQILALGRGRFGGGGGNRQSKGRGGHSYNIILIVLGFGGTYYVFHLERVPSTGRLRFIDVSERQEKEMGNDSFKQVLNENRGKLLPSSDPRVKFVHSVAERIVIASQKSHHPTDHLEMTGAADGGGLKTGNDQGEKRYSGEDGGRSVEWEVFVIKDDQKNAFVLPNGKIFVYSGILPVCQDEDGLATVLGHEIAHQIARHSAEKVSGLKVLMFGAGLLQLIGVDFGMSQVALQLLLSLPNSRKVEMEADQIGLQLMSMACFDPTKAPLFWQRMEASEGGGGGKIAEAAMAVMSTHPLSRKRMESMQGWLPDAVEIRRNSGCPESKVVNDFQSTARRANPFG